MNDEINRIVIFDKNVKCDVIKCNVCKINFTAIQPCIICQLIIERQGELGRKLTEKEFNDLIKGFFGNK